MHRRRSLSLIFLFSFICNRFFKDDDDDDDDMMTMTMTMTMATMTMTMTTVMMMMMIMTMTMTMLMMIVFHQSHETNHKIETLFFSYGFIISGVCYHNKKKNHSIFTLKANYKPQFKNCKLSIPIVCNF